ncbi:3-oxoacyl-CoA synthase [Parastagonospora nodorum]|nr:3-oxoacyl-CoA synthase [Parastagonospora nodorum]KAH4207298.1 3-oxoacyl-CoA synthase [Parastagonospora nodorum]KAH4298494.1 3-oxoacyl-CoA synthase [Parastagonospora nodorum]KAH4318513.1 3-oxoacyl-CoA synthase [Parastagonospora nodorum]KAH4324504.1 3-oxoacyl-CoA synthase [Parastagonospora nodorum]
MSGAGPSLHTPDFPSWSVFKFPPDSAPQPITNPYVIEPTLANPFHIPQNIFEGALAYKVPLAISTVYAITVTYFNWYNRQHANKPWRISKTRPFFAFVIFHNVFLAVYSAITCVAMVRALKTSFPHYSDPNSVVGTVDALCKINGPRGLGDAVTYNSTTNTWASKNSNVLVDSTTGLPDPSDVGRIWNEGLAFWGWWFYLSKFYEVLDTAIILAKGKRSTTLQKYHHAGAMLSMWAGMRFMAPPIWMFVLVNSGIHAMMYTYYTVSALGYRVPNVVKRTLTTLQITQFLVGSAYAAIHLFVSYTIPVTVAHQIVEKVAPKLNSSSISSAVSSATSSAVAALPTATGPALAFLRKLIYRAAGDEGLAENIAVPGEPLPYYQQQQALAAGQRPEHPVEQLFHRPQETVNRVIYRTEYQSVPCIDTSGQAFAIYLNLIYLAPLTFLFMRFFFKSYLSRTSPNTKHQTKHTAVQKATRDASRGVERELESLEKSAEDAVSSAVHKSRDAVRGRKFNANGLDKDERHGSLSPANKKFIDNVNRKVKEQIDGETGTVGEKAKQVGNDLAKAAQDTKASLEKQANAARENFALQAQEAKNKAVDVKDEIKQEANGNANGNANGHANNSEGWETAGKSPKKKNQSKLPQKKKDRKETEESGVLVKKEDIEDEDVKKPENEPEPKDVNNTLEKDEGKGLF